jgi:hypothetical protein
MGQPEAIPKVHPEYGGRFTYYKDIPVGSEFYVHNGHWNGIIVEKDGVKMVHVYATGRTFPIPDDYYGWLSVTPPKDNVVFVYFKDLDVGTEFEITHTNKRGEIIEEGGVKKIEYRGGRVVEIEADSGACVEIIRLPANTPPTEGNALFDDFYAYLNELHPDIDYSIYSALFSKLDALYEHFIGK